MQGAGARRWPRFAVAAAAVSLAFSACDEGVDTLPSNSERQSANERAGRNANWLDVDDNERPTAFLARMTGTERAVIDAAFPAVADHFRESPRMVANRTLQIWQLSRTNAGPSDLEALLQILASAPQGSERVSLGSVAQLYRVQRDHGESHDTALRAALEEAH